MFDGLAPRPSVASRLELDPLDPINRGLLRDLPLGETGGRPLRDIGPRRATGALVGTVDRRAGSHGLVPYFTGGSYASISTGRIVSGLVSWTICVWVRTTQGSGGGVAVYCERGGGGTDIVKIDAMRGGNSFGPTIRDDGGTLLYQQGSITINDGVPHLLTMVKAGTAVRTYVDGRLDGSWTWSGTDTFTESGVSTNVAMDPNDGASNYTGAAWGLRLFSRALSHSEIVRLSASRFAGTVDPLSRLFFAAGGRTVHAFTAASIASASTVGTPALGQVHALGATGVASASSVGTPALAQVHALGATGVASASTVGSPALAQVHALGATGVASASSVGTPILNASPSTTRAIALPARDRTRTIAARSRGVTLPARDRAVILPPERT